MPLKQLCYKLFWTSQKSHRTSKNHELLARYGRFVLKLVLLSGNKDRYTCVTTTNKYPFPRYTKYMSGHDASLP